MARSNSSIPRKNRHKKILKEAKGYFGQNSTNYRRANEQVRKSREYAFRDRRQVKRNFRALWIKRINIAANMYEFNYSKLIRGLKLANVLINRKMLSYLASSDLPAFKDFVDIAKQEIQNEEGKDTKKVKE